jgi:hypothetical protein
VNVLGFAGVLCASGALYLFSQSLGLSAATGFALIGGVTLLLACLLLLRCSDQALAVMARRLVCPFLRLTVENAALLQRPHLFILEEPVTWRRLLLLASVGAPFHVVVVKRARSRAWWDQIAYSIHPRPQPMERRQLIALGRTLARRDRIACVVGARAGAVMEEGAPLPWWERARCTRVSVQYVGCTVAISFR